MFRSGGSGGKCLLPHHAAGEACVAPGGQEVSIFFPVTPPRSVCRSGGSGGRYFLHHRAAGGACVIPGGPGGEYLVCGKYLAFGKCLAFPGSPGWCRVSSLFGMGLTHFVSMGYQVFYFS